MRNFLALALAVCASGAHAQESELAWLAGCWINDAGTSREVWVVDRDGSLAGFSVSIANGDVAFYEVLSITKSSAGRWVYTAFPSNQPAASFAARRVDDNAVQFLNASHDYPQVIEYSREDNSLTAVVSYIGGADAQTFAKTACAGAESPDDDTGTGTGTDTDTEEP